MAKNRTLLKLSIIALLWSVLVVAQTDVDTGAECIDSDPVNCPYWASVGECKANRGYMHQHCRKSCDRCHVTRVNDRSEINKIIAQRRKEIEERQKERRKAKEALKVLDGVSDENKDGPKKSETTAATTATATISSTGEIETNPVSTTIKGASASTSKPITAAATAKTTSSSTTKATTIPPKKKKIKIDAQTGLECVDLDDNCPFWAATGDCLNNRSFMSVNCRLSCDRCHVVRVNNSDEIRKFMERKNKEHEKLRQERKQAQEINKILRGEMY